MRSMVYCRRLASLAFLPSPDWLLLSIQLWVVPLDRYTFSGI